MSLINSIEERAKLAGTNRLEVLMFSLGVDERTGRNEIYGINVFKVREVMHAPPITRAPDMPKGVEGFVSLRGSLVPVIDLINYVGIENGKPPTIMIVTEYNGRIQAFLVESVDIILRLNWEDMKAPPEMLTSETGGLITSITEVDKGLVMMIDVEKILAETEGNNRGDAAIKSVENIHKDRTVFFADDSTVARNQIARTLDAMGVKHKSAVNGKKAWEELLNLANQADSTGVTVKSMVQVILTDVEMPEMDGYCLTKNVKTDKRFAGIPVLMHSSLSGESNHQIGLSVGVDEYIPKFEPQKLSQTLARLLA